MSGPVYALNLFNVTDPAIEDLRPILKESG